MLLLLRKQLHWLSRFPTLAHRLQRTLNGLFSETSRFQLSIDIQMMAFWFSLLRIIPGAQAIGCPGFQTANNSYMDAARKR